MFGGGNEACSAGYGGYCDGCGECSAGYGSSTGSGGDHYPSARAFYADDYKDSDGSSDKVTKKSEGDEGSTLVVEGARASKGNPEVPDELYLVDSTVHPMTITTLKKHYDVYFMPVFVKKEDAEHYTRKRADIYKIKPGQGFRLND